MGQPLKADKELLLLLNAKDSIYTTRMKSEREGPQGAIL
jgi:hypothetical protein